MRKESVMKEKVINGSDPFMVQLEEAAKKELSYRLFSIRVKGWMHGLFGLIQIREQIFDSMFIQELIKKFHRNSYKSWSLVLEEVGKICETLQEKTEEIRILQSKIREEEELMERVKAEKEESDGVQRLACMRRYGVHEQNVLKYRRERRSLFRDLLQLKVRLDNIEVIAKEVLLHARSQAEYLTSIYIQGAGIFLKRKGHGNIEIPMEEQGERLFQEKKQTWSMLQKSVQNLEFIVEEEEIHV